MFRLLGYADRMPGFEQRYPTARLDRFDPARTLLLFASEPYPFAKRPEVLADLPFPSAVVNGECFGWFGSRALRFLEEHAPGPGTTGRQDDG